MANSINGTGSTPENSPLNPVSNEQPVLKDELSSGYSTDSSISYAQGKQNAESDNRVELDNIPTEGADIENPELPFENKLNSIVGRLFHYNDYLSDGHFDFQADTTTLLLVLRGMINDLKVINNAQKIVTVAEERRQYQEMKLEVAVLVTEIAQIDQQLVESRLDLVNKIKELANTKLAHAQLMLALTIVQGGAAESHADVMTAVSQSFRNRPDILAALNNINENVKNGVSVNSESLLLINDEISKFDADISAIQEEIKNLKAEIEALEKERAEKTTRLTVKEILLTLYLYEAIIHRALAMYTVRAASNEEVESSEDRLYELKTELQRLRHFFESEEMEQILQDELNKIEKQDYSKLGKDLFEKASLQSSGNQERADFVSEVFEGLYRVFAPTQIRNADEFRANDVTPEHAIEDVYQALSVILLSRQHDYVAGVTGGAYLGDNLSLEGADDPVAFARLLLTEQMSDLGQQITQQAPQEQINNLLDSEQELQALITTIQQDKEQSHAAIKKGGWA